jgi:hypothetical protein
VKNWIHGLLCGLIFMAVPFLILAIEDTRTFNQLVSDLEKSWKIQDRVVGREKALMAQCRCHVPWADRAEE